MKNLVLLFGMTMSLSSCFIYTKGEDGKPGEPGKRGTNANEKEQVSGFNQKLADSLGADQPP